MSTPVPTVRPPRHYYRFLTSALHSRFVHVLLRSLSLGLICVVGISLLSSNTQPGGVWLNVFTVVLAVISSLIGLYYFNTATSLIGGIGVYLIQLGGLDIWSHYRSTSILSLTLSLFRLSIGSVIYLMCSVFIFSLQIATLEVGQQTKISTWATLSRNLFSSDALKAIFGYGLSAFWFSEAYVWSSSDLGWVTRGSHTTSDTLNERGIFLQAYVLMLAVVSAFTHFYRNHSSLRIPVSRVPSSTSNEVANQSTHPIKPRWSQVEKAFWPAIVRSLLAVLIIIPSGIIYLAFLRSFLYSIHLFFAKLWFDISRTNAHATGFVDMVDISKYLVRCSVAGILLLFTWDMSCNLFLIYFSQEPTKMGLPLSASSKDPNGTLLTGLSSKKPVVQTFAFWELAIIAQKHKDRRQAIFEDIERPSGPMWPQMLQNGLQVLRAIDLRINGPPPIPPSENSHIKSLPSIIPKSSYPSSLPTKPKASWMRQGVSEVLGDFGNSDDVWYSENVEAKVSSALSQVKPSGASEVLMENLTNFLPSPVIALLKISHFDKINATVLGSPAGNAALIVDVIESITKMLVASLTEDTFGKATPTVPDAVRTFTKTLTTIEKFVNANKPGSDSGIEEVGIIVERLRAGLRELLAAFQVYLLDAGLGIAELNQARRAAEGPKSKEAESNDTFSRKSSPPENGTLQNAYSGKQGMRNRTDEPAPNNSRRTLTTNGVRRSGSGSQNGRLFPRKEMEQVR
ncbi:hypothetical protein LTR84_001909 [Exophiala bonariae]|uniref:Nucleoporin NDC1 n=1 Tax=Exophiala bonariae TaxID=1690606 RepID=A0AAV9NGF2_9EURO|nr:hypothetical protein LTR84_001909 [Exophiala bonariae]